MISVFKWQNCQQESSFPQDTTVPDLWQEKSDVLSLISLNILLLMSGIQWSDSVQCIQRPIYSRLLPCQHSNAFFLFCSCYMFNSQFGIFFQGLKNQARVKLNIVRCPPVTTVLIRRPDLRYQLGFSVQNGIVSSFYCFWSSFNTHETSSPFVVKFQWEKREAAVFSLTASRILHFSSLRYKSCVNKRFCLWLHLLHKFTVRQKNKKVVSA